MHLTFHCHAWHYVKCIWYSIAMLDILRCIWYSVAMHDIMKYIWYSVAMCDIMKCFWYSVAMHDIMKYIWYSVAMHDMNLVLLPMAFAVIMCCCCVYTVYYIVVNATYFAYLFSLTLPKTYMFTSILPVASFISWYVSNQIESRVLLQHTECIIT